MSHPFFITEAQTEGKMSKSLAAAGQLHQLASVLETSDAIGKIDWARFLELIMELLPLILALFAEKEKTAK